MNESLEVYNLDGTLIGTQNRDEFYNEIKKEFHEKGLISKKVRTIRVVIMNSLGRIYLQKRSELKNENPNLYDKTVGGHVAAGNTSELTVVKECAEELGFPATVLSEHEFEQAVRSVDLEIVGVLKKIDHLDNFGSVRVTKNGESFVQPFISDMYIGYYDGAIRFVDGESSGVETFSADQLRDAIAANPNKFTEDLKFMAKKYLHLLVPVK